MTGESFKVGYAMPRDYVKDLTRSLLDSVKKIQTGSVVFFETLDDPRKKPVSVVAAFEEAKHEVRHSSLF
jgi:hypothetical protein